MLLSREHFKRLSHFIQAQSICSGIIRGLKIRDYIDIEMQHELVPTSVNALDGSFGSGHSAHALHIGSEITT